MKTTGRFLTLLLQMQPLNAKKQTKSDPNTSQILYICSFFLTCAIRLTKQGRVWDTRVSRKYPCSFPSVLFDARDVLEAHWFKFNVIFFGHFGRPCCRLPFSSPRGGIGIFGFGYFLDRFLGFGVHCGFRIFLFFAFDFQFSRKILTGFRI